MIDSIQISVGSCHETKCRAILCLFVRCAGSSDQGERAGEGEDYMQLPGLGGQGRGKKGVGDAVRFVSKTEVNETLGPASGGVVDCDRSSLKRSFGAMISNDEKNSTGRMFQMVPQRSDRVLSCYLLLLPVSKRKEIGSTSGDAIDACNVSSTVCRLKMFFSRRNLVLLCSLFLAI